MIATLLLLFLAVILGASLGSFFAATYIRITAGESLSGRSCCPQCGEQIKISDNIPIVSWLILGGQSSCCHQPISSFYIKVEGLTALAALLLALFLLLLI